MNKGQHKWRDAGLDNHPLFVTCNTCQLFVFVFHCLGQNLGAFPYVLFVWFLTKNTSFLVLTKLSENYEFDDIMDSKVMNHKKSTKGNAIIIFPLIPVFLRFSFSIIFTPSKLCSFCMVAPTASGCFSLVFSRL